MQAGSQVQEQCVQICGDYEQLNDQIHLSTSTLKPDDEMALQQFNSQTNGACSVLKCSARCSADNFNKQCGRLSNGQMAGDLIREIVERMLATYRVDLQVFGLMPAMQKNTQPECNYLFVPEVLFSPLKDAISRQASKKSEVLVERTSTQSEAIPDKRMEEMLQVRILKKKLEVLNKQLEILNKQEHKIDANNYETPRFMQAPSQEFEPTGMF